MMRRRVRGRWHPIGRGTCLGVGVALAAFLVSVSAKAHTTGESFFSLQPQAAGGGRGVWELALRDLDDAVGLDADGDGAITVREFAAGRTAITAHVLPRVIVQTDAGPCRPVIEDVAATQRSGGGHALLTVRLGCPATALSASASWLSLSDRLFFERDGLHRAFVTVQIAGHRETRLLRAEAPEARFVGGAVAGNDTGGTVTRFVAEGALHIWQGLDHVLFLLVLLLPAVLQRTRDVGHHGDRSRWSWTPASSWRAVLTDVVRIVTAFTLAHSLTLGLSAVGVLHAAPRIIEPAIAASVLLAAVNNLWPVFGRDRWVVAFALGLLHGFGFSSVLADIGLPPQNLLPALFGFNLGVELGQLALVVGFLPVAFCLRKSVGYRRFGLVAGSAVAGAVAAAWFLERGLGISLLG